MAHTRWMHLFGVLLACLLLAAGCSPFHPNANLHGKNLAGRSLVEVDLSGADLSEADLSGADLHAVSLQNADLVGSVLDGAKLTQADLDGADLSEASLVAANLQGSTLVGADLTGADLSRSNWLDVQGLQPEMLAGARGLDSVVTHHPEQIAAALGPACEGRPSPVQLHLAAALPPYRFAFLALDSLSDARPYREAAGENAAVNPYYPAYLVCIQTSEVSLDNCPVKDSASGQTLEVGRTSITIHLSLHSALSGVELAQADFSRPEPACPAALPAQPLVSDPLPDALAWLAAQSAALPAP